MTPILLRLARAASTSLVRRYAFSALALALSLWLGHAIAPADRSEDLQRAETVGYHAAKHAAFHRNLARVAIDSLTSAKRRADATYASEHAKLQRLAARPITTGLIVRVDPAPRVIVGPVTPTDSLIALPTARAILQQLADSANVALANVRASALLERGRSSLALQRMQETLGAQDTVIASLRTQLALVKAARSPWYRRAIMGTAHAGAGIACGATGWALGGPVVGLGAGALCAGVAGVLK